MPRSRPSASPEPTPSARARRPRVDPAIEAQILALAFSEPASGQDRVSRALRAAGIQVSASGVRYVWQRHDLETVAKRVERIEAALGRDEHRWSAAQLSARDRVKSGRLARSLGASIVGQAAESVPRSLHILAVAARVFRERGYDPTTLRDIAVRAHIPLGSLYYHFPSKEALFAAVYEEGIDRLSRLVGDAIAAGTDPWDRLTRSCVVHVENLCGGDDFTAVSLPTKLPDVSDAVRARLARLDDRYEALFRRLIDDLPLAPGFDRSLVRLQLLGAMNWTSIWYRPGKATPAGIAAHLVALLRTGVSGTQTPPARARRTAR